MTSLMMLQNARAAAMPLLASDMSDEALLAELRRYPDLQAVILSEAQRLMRMVPAIFPLSQNLAAEWLAYRGRMARAATPSGVNANSAADQAAQVARLRIAIDARETFGRYSKASAAELAAMAQQAKRDADMAVQLQRHAHVRVPPPFDPRAFVTRLGQRGMVLSVSETGDLRVSPGASADRGGQGPAAPQCECDRRCGAPGGGDPSMSATRAVGEVLKADMMPLDILLGVMRGTLKVTEQQFQALVAILPYMHAPMAPTDPGRQAREDRA